MGREEEIVAERKRKIQELKKKGVNPYSHRFDFHEKRAFSQDVADNYSKLKVEEISSKEEIVAGRVMFLRSFGKLAFAKIQDLKGNIQAVLQSGKTDDKTMDFFNSYVDTGDIIGVRGNVMKTKTGEVSILVKELQLLTKSVLPLPDKVHGLQDEEERLRKRYLDVIMNPDVKELFIKKQRYYATMRNFLVSKGFLEVETPVLENSAGGAAATPFKTHHNALNLDVFLRISMGELWQKKLLVAGYEKTFEMGRQFRNEGMDAEHLQDYSQMEFYWGYANFEDGMKLVEEMYKQIAMAVNGSLVFESRGHKVDLGKKWERYDYEKLIQDKTGLNIYKAEKKDIVKFLEKEKIEFDPNVDKWRLIDVLWKFCRKQLSGPGFLVGQPVELTPLAKRSEKDPRKVEQFQVILAGSECGNGYSELNDPLDQEERFEDQRKKKEAGDTESMEHDVGFVEALKYGMPPACGFGVSERFFSFLVNRPIRECVVFPLMRPAGDEEKNGKETNLAVAIINKGLKMKKWEEMNTIAHLNAAFGARAGKRLFYQEGLNTKDKKHIQFNISDAIMIKAADKNSDLINLKAKAKENGLETSEFIKEMIETSDDKKIIEIVAKKNLKDLDYYGLLVYGKKSIVEKLTKDFPLFK